MVETDGLQNHWGCKALGGSNPSARAKNVKIISKIFFRKRSLKYNGIVETNKLFFDILEAKMPKCRSGENGIHGRLKICWAQALEGSSPSFGTEFPLVNEKSNYWVKNKI